MNIALNPTFTQVLLLLTNRCNLTCKHCYVSSEPNGEYGLSKDRVFQLIDEIHHEYGRVLMSISGGEPLSRKKDCLDILTYAAQKLQVRLLTNATLITPAIARKLTELGISIRVSIDGGVSSAHDFIRGTGAFEKTVQGIKNLKDAGFPLSSLQIYATITHHSVEQIPAIIRFAEETGIGKIKFETLAMDGRALMFWEIIPNSNPHENYFQYFKNAFDKNHGQNWNIEDMTPYDMAFTCLTVYYNGDTFPYTYTDARDRSIGYLGNINEQPLESIIAGERLPNAILQKFLLMATGPKRSLQAYWVTKK